MTDRQTDRQTGVRKCYSTVDVCKLIMAVLVLIMHSNTLHTSSFFNMFNYCFTTIAVPFFFIISGYFFEKGLARAENKQRYLFSYEKKLLLLYLCWAIVMLPSVIINYNRLYTDKDAWYIFLLILRRYFLCGEGVFWYILVMAESAIVIYFISMLKKKWVLLICIVMGLLLCLLYDSNMIQNFFIDKMNSFFYSVFSWSNNFIMKGVPFMGIGFLLNGLDERNPRTVCKVSLIVFLLVSIVSVALYILNYRIGYIYILQTVSIALFSIHFYIDVPAEKSIVIRELSSSIYFLHTFFLYYFIEIVFGKELFIPLKAFLAIALCIITYTIIKMILKKFDIKILKIMFNIK